MRQLICALTATILFSHGAFPARYYVDAGSAQASDQNNGSLSAPWRTVQHAADNVSSPGDIIHVRAGTYDEYVTCRFSGDSARGFITYVGYAGDAKPVLRGFYASNKRYLRIIGFEITHNATTYSRGITLADACDHIEVLDNYMHNTNGEGGQVRWYNSNNSYITVRGNELFMSSCPQGTPASCTGNGWAIQMAGGHHNLIEYNTAHRVGDFVNVHSTYTVVRNNYLYDFRDSYWTTTGVHADIFQPCGMTAQPSQYQIYESNFAGENWELNSHILQMRTASSDDHHIMFRGNVGYDHGSYAMQCGGVDNCYFYNNTIYNVNILSPNAAATGYNAEGGDLSLANQNFNNIFSRAGLGPVIDAAGSSVVTSSDNLCHGSGNHASCESSSAPLFVDTATHDFHLQAGSPAIGMGKAVTTVTSPTGSGTSFDVAQADLLSDGYGIVEGDIIAVGRSAPVRIVRIASNSITIDSAVAWRSGDAVVWRDQDTLPDAGAYEYRGDGHAISLQLTQPAEGTVVRGNVTVTANAGNAACIRFVLFYVDGVPLRQDFDAPFACVWDASAEAVGSQHIVEARAYALHASPAMVQMASVNVTVSGLSGSADRLVGQHPRLQGGVWTHGTGSGIEVFTLTGRLVRGTGRGANTGPATGGQIPPGLYHLRRGEGPDTFVRRAVLVE